MDILTKEEVLHVASLARLDVLESDIPFLQTELKQIINEIEKINQVDISGDLLISPSNNQNVFFTDLSKEHLTTEEVLKNAKNKSGSYIEVVGALND